MIITKLYFIKYNFNHKWEVYFSNNTNNKRHIRKYDRVCNKIKVKDKIFYYLF